MAEALQMQINGFQNPGGLDDDEDVWGQSPCNSKHCGLGLTQQACWGEDYVLQPRCQKPGWEKMWAALCGASQDCIVTRDGLMA
jgi:hypothetical protein